MADVFASRILEPGKLLIDPLRVENVLVDPVADLKLALSGPDRPPTYESSDEGITPIDRNGFAPPSSKVQVQQGAEIHAASPHTLSHVDQIIVRKLSGFREEHGPAQSIGSGSPLNRNVEGC